MSQGRNAEALRVFQKIYALNSRKPRTDFPVRQFVSFSLNLFNEIHFFLSTILQIKELINETQNAEKESNASTASIATIESVVPKEKENEPASKVSLKEKKPKVSLRQGWEQLRPLLSKPYLGLSIRVYLMNFAILFG